MKIFTFEQGTLEWNAVRAGVVTASEMKNLLTNKLAIKKIDGEGVTTYMCRKLAEKWRGGPLPQMGKSLDMEFGHLREERAIPDFELKQDRVVRRVGFILADDGLTGCSPDGLLEDEQSGLEVKCLQDQNHIEYLLAGVLPEEFAAQVHASMYVTGFKTWHFYGYSEMYPPLLLVVHRDEAIMEKMDEAVTNFMARLALNWQLLMKLDTHKTWKPNTFRDELINPKPEPVAAQAAPNFDNIP